LRRLVRRLAFHRHGDVLRAEAFAEVDFSTRPSPAHSGHALMPITNPRAIETRPMPPHVPQIMVSLDAWPLPALIDNQPAYRRRHEA